MSHSKPYKYKFKRLRVIKICLVLLIALTHSKIQAQKVLVAIGGSISDYTDSGSQSARQLHSNSNNRIAGFVAQGVHYSYEISVASSSGQLRGIDLVVLAYPIPTTGFLMIKAKNYEVRRLSYQLYNLNGELLANKKLESCETRLFMNKHLSSTYFLKIKENNKEVITYKIIKN